MKHRSLKTFLLLVLCSFLSTAAMAQKDGKKVTLTCEKEPLTQALRAVEKLSGFYKINYSYDELKRYTVTASIQEQSAPEAVDMLLRGLPYTSVVQGRFISVQPKPGTTADVAQQRISAQSDGVAQGKIVDRNKEPLPFVTIRVVGKGSVGISDAGGKFYIQDVQPDDVLEFSYVGMATVRHTVGNKPLVVVMEEDNTLEDVVVTGIFPKRKDAYTGAVTTITSEELKNYGNKNLISFSNFKFRFYPY